VARRQDILQAVRSFIKERAVVGHIELTRRGHFRLTYRSGGHTKAFFFTGKSTDYHALNNVLCELRRHLREAPPDQVRT